MIHTYGARRPDFRPAPKPDNFEQLAAAAAAGDRETFDLEAAKYRQQCARAGVHPGQDPRWLDEGAGQ